LYVHIRLFHIHKCDHCSIEHSIDYISIIDDGNALNYHFPCVFASDDAQGLGIQRVGANNNGFQQFADLYCEFLILLKIVIAAVAIDSKKYRSL
jgi:hypothetical protein